MEILKNEKYTGNALLQKKFVVDHLQKSLIKNNGKLPMYYAEETHEGIIDMQTFKEAQEILGSRREKYGGKGKCGNYIFTSLIVCGICGKKYRHQERWGKASWQCNTYLKYGKKTCLAKKVPEEVLIKLSCEVLNLEEFKEGILKEKVKEINKTNCIHNLLMCPEGNVKNLTKLNF